MADVKTKIESGSFSYGFVALIVSGLLLVVVLGYWLGHFKGLASCKAIQADNARKSLEVAQTASNNTAEFSREQLRLIEQLKQRIKEVDDATLEQTMSDDLIDILNR